MRKIINTLATELGVSRALIKEMLFVYDLPKKVYGRAWLTGVAILYQYFNVQNPQ